MHFCGRLVTLARVAGTGLEDDFVQAQQLGPLAGFIELGRQVWKVLAILPSAHFVQNLAQAVEVGGRTAGAFGRDVALRSHESRRLTDLGHQANVGKFGKPVDEDDVGRLDVPMNEAPLVQVAQGLGQRNADLPALRQGQFAAQAQFPA